MGNAINAFKAEAYAQYGEEDKMDKQKLQIIKRINFYHCQEERYYAKKAKQKLHSLQWGIDMFYSLSFLLVYDSSGKGLQFSFKCDYIMWSKGFRLRNDYAFSYISYSFGHVAFDMFSCVLPEISLMYILAVTFTTSATIQTHVLHIGYHRPLQGNMKISKS